MINPKILELALIGKKVALNRFIEAWFLPKSGIEHEGVRKNLILLYIQDGQMVAELSNWEIQSIQGKNTLNVHGFIFSVISCTSTTDKVTTHQIELVDNNSETVII